MMTVEQSAAEADVKIGPVLFSWKWHLASTLGGLSLAAKASLHGSPWVALTWLILVCGSIALLFVVRTLGVYLTPECAVIRGRRRRRVPWQEVRSVVSHVDSNGKTSVRLMLENGEPVALPFPKTLWRKGDAQYERDFQRIDQWWLAHRASPDPRSPRGAPPTQGEREWDSQRTYTTTTLIAPSSAERIAASPPLGRTTMA